MNMVRALIRDHRTLAMLLMAMALFVKILVPAGYMASAGQKLFSVQICLDGVHHTTVQMAVPFNDGQHDGQQDQNGKGGSEHCAFTSLTMGVLGGADAPLLGLAIAFILALGFAPIQPVLRGRNQHLRPPLRGPPALN